MDRNYLYVRDRDCNGCLHDQPRFICATAVVTYPGSGSEPECCETFRFPIDYKCEVYNAQGDPIPAEYLEKTWIGQGHCEQDPSLQLNVYVKPVNVDGHCVTKVWCPELFGGFDPIVIDVDGSGCGFFDFTFEGDDAAGIHYVVTVRSGMDEYIQNPLATQQCPACTCATIIPRKLCATLRLYPGDIPLEECDPRISSRILEFDCDRTWLPATEFNVDGVEYIVRVFLSDPDYAAGRFQNKCSITATIDGGVFAQHDVMVGDLNITDNPTVYNLEHGGHPCLGGQTCVGPQNFKTGEGVQICEPDPQADTKLYHTGIAFEIVVYKEGDTGPRAGELRIEEIRCGTGCEATDPDSCNGACPGFEIPTLGCDEKILACEVVSPGCTVDGTILNLKSRGGFTPSPDAPLESCQVYVSDSLTITNNLGMYPICEADGFGGSFQLGLAIWYEYDPRCDASSVVDMSKYRLYYQFIEVCGLDSYLLTGTLLPEPTSTCSPPVLEFKFDCDLIRQSAGSIVIGNCDCCDPSGPTGDCMFRITL
jgi:hypothetical protein